MAYSNFCAISLTFVFAPSVVNAQVSVNIWKPIKTINILIWYELFKPFSLCHSGDGSEGSAVTRRIALCLFNKLHVSLFKHYFSFTIYFCITYCFALHSYNFIFFSIEYIRFVLLIIFIVSFLPLICVKFLFCVCVVYARQNSLSSTFIQWTSAFGSVGPLKRRLPRIPSAHCQSVDTVRRIRCVSAAIKVLDNVFNSSLIIITFCVCINLVGRYCVIFCLLLLCGPIQLIWLKNIGACKLC